MIDFGGLYNTLDFSELIFIARFSFNYEGLDKNNRQMTSGGPMAENLVKLPAQAECKPILN